MGIQCWSYSAGQWSNPWSDDRWFEGSTGIEQVKFQLVNAPPNAHVFYQIKYWDNQTKSFIWTAPKLDSEEVGRLGCEIYGLHFMLIDYPGAQIYIQIKNSGGWKASHPVQVESSTPIVGLQVLIRQEI